MKWTSSLPLQDVPAFLALLVLGRPLPSSQSPEAPSPADPAGTTLGVVEVESYDPYTDSWTPVQPALKYVSNFSVASCRGRLYLVGSSACKYNALALQCYNPVTGRHQGHRVGPDPWSAEDGRGREGGAKGWGI